MAWVGSVSIKLGIFRSDDADLVRALQLIQLAFDKVPDASVSVSAYITKNYTVSSNVDFVFADSSGGAITVTLPSTGTSTVTVRNTSSSSNAVTVQQANAAKISGSQAVVAVSANKSVAFRWNSMAKVWFTV